MIDVIIPVFEGLEETRRCLESALATCAPEMAEVVVVDDATPNAAIASYLDGLSAAGRITLLRNAANAGFVVSANRGMALHDDRDVILLNSDAEVANDWGARLRAAAHSAPNVATVTPFSNNATICSYPYDGWKGRIPGTLGLGGLDRLIAQANRGKVVELPTAVGFCMFVRRDCIREIGTFDAARFGRGYGEENDFCLRAAKAGWRNVLACDVLVFHEGGVSFSESRAAQMQSAATALLEAHPEYGRLVQEFIAADPVLPMRQAIDAARANTNAQEAVAVLDERAAERAALLSRLHEVASALAERDAAVRRLEAGLAEATAFVAERTADAITLAKQVQERDGAIERLQQGLSHAETLAFARQRELEQIKSFWLWKYFNHVMQKSSSGKGPGP